MLVLLAPDKFKECLTASEAAKAMDRGIRRNCPGVKTIRMPAADGGEGTVDTLVKALHGRTLTTPVRDPLGKTVRARWGVVRGGRTAVIEMAAASGLHLVPVHKRNPLLTSSEGTGQLIRSALDHGCREIVLGIGGSATVDGGMGMAQGLGVRFFDRHGRRLGRGGRELLSIARIDISGIDRRLSKIRVRVACDVTNPLDGPKGAARIYGPQKGATPSMIERLDRGLKQYSNLLSSLYHRDFSRVPGAGAAGGLGAGAMAFLGARLESGIGLVLDILQMEKSMRNADLTLTGEGRTDGQSASGKVADGLGAIARKTGVPLVILCGSMGPGHEKLYRRGVTSIFPIVPGPTTLRDSMQNTAEHLARTASQVVKLFGQKTLKG
ncbi:MAG TPA: glycerate kinase [Elusimicrobiota bacterium]|nr:glycerate kinase [Elusimicrobiota bacterium]